MKGGPRYLAALTVLLASTRGQAEPHWQAVGETSLGYTDNAQAAPTDSEDDSVVSRSVFLMLSPGAVLAYASPRLLQRLSYRYEYDLYFASGASSSTSNRLDYRGFFDLSPRWTLVLGASATQSDRFNSVTFGAPGASAVGAVPAGTGSYLSGGVDEGLSVDLGPGWRAWQSGYALVDMPIFGTEAPRTLGTGARLGVEHAFQFDSVGLEGRADYSVIDDSIETDGTPLGQQRQLVAGGVVLWRHDWARDWSSGADAGALRVQRFNSDKGFWTPTGTASVFYTTEHGDAQLSYGHTVTTNALLGQTMLIDEVRLRGEVPLTREGELGGHTIGEITLAATLAYQRGKLIDEDATLATRVRVILGDISLSWQATKLVTLGARYQHVQQKSGANTPPLPVSFVQNNVLIGATLRFPPDKDMPRAYRAPQRVDRSDEIRDGLNPDATGPRSPGGQQR